MVGGACRPFLCAPLASLRANGAKPSSFRQGELKNKTETAYKLIIHFGRTDNFFTGIFFFFSLLVISFFLSC